MFNKILVALDPEETSLSLFHQAIALAQSTGANLKLMSVLIHRGDGTLPLFAYYPGFAGYPLGTDESFWEEYQKRRETDRTREQARLRHLCERARAAGVNADYMQTSGSPGREICELAESWEADLVMVGSRGRKGLSEMLLGSVSNYVMHHARCSVMIVHPEESEKLGAQTTGRTPESAAAS